MCGKSFDAEVWSERIDDLLFSLQDKFLPFLDMFQKETIKVDVCKLVMEAFVK